MLIRERVNKIHGRPRTQQGQILLTVAALHEVVRDELIQLRGLKLDNEQIVRHIGQLTQCYASVLEVLDKRWHEVLPNFLVLNASASQGVNYLENFFSCDFVVNFNSFLDFLIFFL